MFNPQTKQSWMFNNATYFIDRYVPKSDMAIDSKDNSFDISTNCCLIFIILITVYAIYIDIRYCDRLKVDMTNGNDFKITSRPIIYTRQQAKAT